MLRTTVTRLGVATCRERPEPQADDALMLRQLDGIEVVAVPWDAPMARWAGCDAVLLRSVWDYHRRVEEFLARLESLEAAGARVWNGAAAVAWNARKTYLRDLEAAGVPTVPTLWLQPEAVGGWPATIERSGWDDVVLKPIVGASSFLTWRSSAQEAGARADRLARLAAHGGALLQPFVREVESAGEWSLVYFERRFSHAVRKRGRPGEFRVQTEFGGTEEAAEPPAEVRALAESALAVAPGDPLYARVDGIETAAGFVVSELELIEPVLFLACSERAAADFARAVAARLRS